MGEDSQLDLWTAAVSCDVDDYPVFPHEEADAELETTDVPDDSDEIEVEIHPAIDFERFAARNEAICNGTAGAWAHEGVIQVQQQSTMPPDPVALGWIPVKKGGRRTRTFAERVRPWSIGNDNAQRGRLGKDF